MELCTWQTYFMPTLKSSCRYYRFSWKTHWLSQWNIEPAFMEIKNSNYRVLHVLLHGVECFNMAKGMWSFSLPFCLQPTQPDVLVAAFRPFAGAFWSTVILFSLRKWFFFFFDMQIILFPFYFLTLMLFSFSL